VDDILNPTLQNPGSPSQLTQSLKKNNPIHNHIHRKSTNLCKTYSPLRSPRRNRGPRSPTQEGSMNKILTIRIFQNSLWLPDLQNSLWLPDLREFPVLNLKLNA
jgi:hypothetical protein